GLLVAGLGSMVVQTVRPESARAPAGRWRTQTAGRCAGDVCEGQGAVKYFAIRAMGFAKVVGYVFLSVIIATPLTFFAMPYCIKLTGSKGCIPPADWAVPVMT